MIGSYHIVSFYARPQDANLIDLLCKRFYPNDKRKRGVVIMDALKMLAKSTGEKELIEAVRMMD